MTRTRVQKLKNTMKNDIRNLNIVKIFISIIINLREFFIITIFKFQLLNLKT